MANGVLLVFVILSPTLLAYAVLGAARLWRRLRTRDRCPIATNQPIERIATDVRRLYGERQGLLAQPPGPGRGSRTRALTAAYLDVLVVACRALEVVPPQTTGATPAAEIERVEVDLRLRGLDVRRPAVR